MCGEYIPAFRCDAFSHTPSWFDLYCDVFTITAGLQANPAILFEVFIHKVDGDAYLHEDHKVGTCRRARLVCASAVCAIIG